MPSLRKLPKAEVIAILVSDFHLSLTAPVARSVEPNWLAVQGRHCAWLSELSIKHKCPIICAGDIFHRWNSPPELINWAIQHLPPMYAIPGQHDLPLHSYEDIRKSAYWTLVEAKVIEDMEPNEHVATFKDGIRFWIHPFPWGKEVKPAKPEKGIIHLAVVHSYCWAGEQKYPGAPEASGLSSWRKRLRGYDVALIGDNHKPFLSQLPNDGCRVLNHGAFIPRTSDECHHIPKAGLLYSDGTIKLEPFDTSADLWLPENDPALIEESSFTVAEFVKELKDLGTDCSIDFESALRTYFSTYQITPGARKLILQALDQHTKS